MLKCLYAGTLALPAEAREALATHGVELVRKRLARPPRERELQSAIANVDAVLAGAEPYTAKLIESAHRLKIIARTGIGYDAIDIRAAAAKGVIVTWTPIPELASSVAEHTIALILASSRRIPFLDREVRQGRWERSKWSGDISDLHGQTLGILGLGRIGKEVARRGGAFGMRVVYHDLRRMADAERELGVRYASFGELLEISDILSLHIPLTPRTYNLIDSKAISRMKSTAVLVNTSRGAVVDESALAEALRKGIIRGAALDVMTEEPPSRKHVFYKLRDELPSLILTPHLGAGRDAFRAMAGTAVADVIRVLGGEKPRYPLVAE